MMNACYDGIRPKETASGETFEEGSIQEQLSGKDICDQQIFVVALKIELERRKHHH